VTVEAADSGLSGRSLRRRRRDSGLENCRSRRRDWGGSGTGSGFRAQVSGFRSAGGQNVPSGGCRHTGRPRVQSRKPRERLARVLSLESAVLIRSTEPLPRWSRRGEQVPAADVAERLHEDPRCDSRWRWLSRVPIGRLRQAAQELLNPTATLERPKPGA